MTPQNVLKNGPGFELPDVAPESQLETEMGPNTQAIGDSHPKPHSWWKSG